MTRRAGVILSEAKNLGSCRALARKSQTDPLPRGRYALRMSPELYRELVFEAKVQGLSLYQFIVHKLSRAAR